MPKSKFDRYSLKHNLLKRVAIRIDFDGLTNLDALIQRLKRHELAEIFGSYRKLVMPVGGQFSDDDSIDGPTHVFYDYLKTKDKVELTLSLSRITIQIGCVEYGNIDSYLVLMEQVAKAILMSDAYVEITKIGIRKIAAFENPSPIKVFNIFEKDMFMSDKILKMRKKEDIKGVRTKYEDTLLCLQKYPVMVSLKRLVRHLFDPVERTHQLQAILDIEGSIDGSDIKDAGSTVSIEDIFSAMQVINDELFEMFKTSVTLKYLNAHGCLR
jgi:hypothetical protein